MLGSRRACGGACARLIVAPSHKPLQRPPVHGMHTLAAPPSAPMLRMASTGPWLLAGSIVAGVGLAYYFSSRSSPPPPPPPPPAPRPIRRKLMAFGSNRFGQLMLADETDRVSPTPVGLPGTPLSMSAASKSSAVVLEEHGRLLAAGASNEGRLGFDGAGVYSSPVTVLPEDASKVALGELGGAVITREARLIIFGRCKGPNESPAPECPITDERMCEVACGRHHVLALDANGSVHAMGDNRHGALGLGHRDVVAGLHRVPGLARVTSVACGRNFSLCATQDGAVYSWGADDHGALSHGKASRWQVEPKRVEFAGERVAMVAAGDLHALALCEDGSVWSAGMGLDGQLGNGQRDDHAAFARVPLPGPASKVSCGAGHSAALMRDGSLYLWGRGDSGQLGRGAQLESTGRRLSPVRCEALGCAVLDVALGGDHTLALVDEAKLL